MAWPAPVRPARGRAPAGRGHVLADSGLQCLQLGLVVRRPDVLDLPRPCRDEYTTCIAVAPDFVFPVLIYGTSPLYEPPLVRKSSS